MPEKSLKSHKLPLATPRLFIFARAFSVDKVLMAGLLLAAFALRVYQLDAQSIWWDEGISLHLATSPWAEIVADRLNNIHPPLYFFILKVWVSLTGVTPFAARYLSVLASWLQVSAVFVFCKVWTRINTDKHGPEGQTTESVLTIKTRSFVWVATFLLTISPLSVVYGQEIRVYAMLPLVFLGLLVIGHWLLAHSLPPALRSSPLTPWVLLGVVEWLGLHLHYIALLMVTYTAVWLLLSLFQQKRWTDLRNWFVTHLLVGLASLPWFVAVLRNWTAVQAEANTGTFQTEAVPLQFLVSQVWVFHLTGLAGALSQPLVKELAGLTAVFLSMTLFIRLLQPVARPPTLLLLAHWLLPLTAAFALWSVRSFSHPRYVAMFAAGLIPLMAYAMTTDRRPTTAEKHLSALHRAPGTLSCLLVILLSVIGLRLYFFDPGVAKDDVRAVATYLETAAFADDLILVPDTDWSLPFEYHGEALVIMPDVANPEAMWANLATRTEVHRRVFVLDYERGTLDWQGVVPFALESAGALTAVDSFDGLRLRTYDLNHPVQAPPFQPVGSRFGPLILREAWVETQADTAVTLALRWQLQETTHKRYSLTTRLLDVDEWVLAAEDDRLVNENGRSTDQWQPGQLVITYHILPRPLYLPPLPYRLVVGLYTADGGANLPVEVIDAQGTPQGQWVEIGEVTAEKTSYNNPYALPNPIPSTLKVPLLWNNGLMLRAVTDLPLTLHPGQPVVVELFWQATLEGLADLRPRLALVQNNQELFFDEGSLVLGRYPTHLWQLWETVAEHRRLVVPPGSSGTAEFTLSLEDQTVVLGEVQIAGETHLFEPPAMANSLEAAFVNVGQLVGYELLTTTLTTADSIPLTLYWQATETGTPTAYTVFAHLLDENGRLIAQHDSPPENGRRPTPGWVTGEYITDPHLLTFRENYSGLAHMEVGLYDPISGARVMLENGRDAFILPVVITVVNQ